MNFSSLLGEENEPVHPAPVVGFPDGVIESQRLDVQAPNPRTASWVSPVATTSSSVVGARPSRSVSSVVRPKG